MEEFDFDRLSGSLVEATQAYMAASHFFWSLWGVIQSKVSEVDWELPGLCPAAAAAVPADQAGEAAAAAGRGCV